MISKQTKTWSKLFISIALAAATMSSALFIANNGKSFETKALYSPGTTYSVTTPSVYYSGISSSATGSTLLSSLQALNSSQRKTTIGYKPMGTSTSSSPYIYTDYNPSGTTYTDSKGQVYGTSLNSFYTKTVMTSFNKEHVWPNSRGGEQVEADIHMPRPTITVENSNRGNSLYVEGVASDNAGWDPYKAGFSEIARGESARIIFYSMVASTRLYLTDDKNVSSGGTSTEGYPYAYTMGKLSDLLKWNLEYDVTQYENNRNNGAQYLQGNRNPFIDHPEYACKIWGNTNTTTKSICATYSTPPSNITLSPSSASIAANTELTIEVSVDKGSNSVTWKSSDSTIASVDNGVVKGLKTGTATITAASTLDATVSGTCVVSVKSLSSLEVSGVPDKVTYTAGESFDPKGVVVTATYSDTSTENVVSSVVWTPTTLTTSTTSVTGSYGGKTVQVNNITVISSLSVKITKSNSGLPTTASTSNLEKSYTVTGDTKTLKMIWEAGCYNTVQYDEFAIPNGVKLKSNDTVTIKTIVADFYYGNSNSAVYANGQVVQGVATTVAGSSGTVYTYTINSSSWYIIGTSTSYAQCIYSLTFALKDGSSSVPVTGITLNKSSLSLKVGDNETLTATISPSNATNQNLSWTSSDTSIATISGGVVTGVKEGAATITVKTEDGSFIASCSVTVLSANTKKGGCGGSIATTSALVSGLALFAVVFIIIKRKKMA